MLCIYTLEKSIADQFLIGIDSYHLINDVNFLILTLKLIKFIK